MNEHWNGANSTAVFQNSITGSWHITPAFQKHCEDHRNWSVGSLLLRILPDLRGKIWIEDKYTRDSVHHEEFSTLRGSGDLQNR